MIRQATSADAEAIERFLLTVADSSMILRSNLRSAGFEWAGQPYQGQYVIRLDGPVVTGVVGHAWNGNLVLQAPSNVAELARRALEVSGRELEGFIGPWAQVEAARLAFGFAPDAFSLLAREVLMRVLVSEVGAVEGVRLARLEELEPLTAWAANFEREALFEEPDVAAVRANLERGLAAGNRWYVLEEAGALRAMGAFNARTPDAVQLGGIYTPPEGRNRGSARRLVAGMLKQSGVERGVLFAKDPAAIRSYRAVGFRECGEYGLALLK